MARIHPNHAPLPRRASRARRIMDALYDAQQPVQEKVLMAAHGLDQVPATIWRQGPYKSLESTDMIEKNGAGCWSLTPRARALMDVAELGVAAAEEPARGDLVPPRTAPSSRPLVRRDPMQLAREGALDYRTIPSLHMGKRHVIF